MEFRISARLQPEKMQDLQGTLRISLQVEYTGHIFPECLRNVAELLKKRRSAFFSGLTEGGGWKRTARAWYNAGMTKILVVEDDADLNQSVCSFLRRHGYEVTGCLLANDAYNALYNTLFDLIISDIMMPQTDGFAFAATVRKINQTIPIIFMTARDDFAAKQQGFAAGIDDYMVKPVDLDELLLRIAALLRRANIAQSKRLTVGSLTLDADAVTATSGGKEIALTAREFNLTYKLLSYPNKTFTRIQLMDEFWDADSNASPRAVDVYITKLREKFSGCSGFEIVTVRGLGYKAVLK